MRLVASWLLIAALAGCGGNGASIPPGPVTGTYSGVFMIFGSPMGVTANLSENASTFALSGTAHGDSSASFCDIPGAATSVSGSVTGSTVAFSFMGTAGANITFSGTATDNTFSTISGNIDASGPCSGIQRPLTLVRQ